MTQSPRPGVWRIAMRILGIIMLNLLVLTVCGSVLFGAAELYFRLRYPAPPSVGHLVFDPDLGWDTSNPVVALPGDTGTGMNIYYIGDSFTDDKKWPGLTQDLLRDRGMETDGYVLGVSGYGTTQEYIKLQRHFTEHPPKVVALLFFAWNDMRDNERSPGIFYSPTHYDRPYFVPSGSGLTLRQPHTSVLTRLLSHSEVHTRLLQRFVLKILGRLAGRYIDTFTAHQWPVKLYYDEPASWKPFYDPTRSDSPYVRESYAATEESLRRMRDFLARHSSRLVVIGIDNAFTVDRDVRDRYIGSGTTLDLHLPLRRMEEMTGRLDIPFVNTLPALQKLSQSQDGRKVYNGPAGNIAGHFELAGEEVVAASAADAIVDVLRGRK